jgi:predicted RNase H-like HicB family nuclease
MSKQYRVRVALGRQEDGLWRAEVPSLPGCFVDAPTVAEAIADIQEVIAMALDDCDEQGLPPGDEVVQVAGEPDEVFIPVPLHEFDFVRPKPRRK